MPVNDWFTDCRDAVAVALRAALATAEVGGVDVLTQDTLAEELVSLPVVVVSFNASERQVGGTNARDDYAYPIQVAYLTLQAGQGRDADGGDPPPGEFTPLQFRQLVRETFHHRRSVTVAGIDVFLVEYDPEGAVLDDARPAFQQLRAAAAVTCYARVPRGS